MSQETDAPKSTRPSLSDRLRRRRAKNELTVGVVTFAFMAVLVGILTFAGHQHAHAVEQGLQPPAPRGRGNTFARMCELLGASGTLVLGSTICIVLLSMSALALRQRRSLARVESEEHGPSTGG